MKRFVKYLFFFISFLTTLAGCAKMRPAESVSEEPAELSWYVNFSWYNTQWGGNAVSGAVTERTGADIRFESPDGSESEALDALIAGNRLPDLVTLGWWETQLDEIIDQDLVYPLLLGRQAKRRRKSTGSQRLPRGSLLP